MANNEQISQEVKVEETRPVSAENETTSVVKAEETKVNAKQETKANKVEPKAKKQKKSKDKKPSRIAKSLKETSSELKKVTWPKFGTVVKQTGVVLLVALVFLLVVFGIDRLCSWLMGFIV